VIVNVHVAARALPVVLTVRATCVEVAAVISLAGTADPSILLSVLRLSIWVIVAGVYASEMRHAWIVGLGALVTTRVVLRGAVVRRCLSGHIGTVEVLGHGGVRVEKLERDI
jgi:hypothetical protein